MAQQFSTEPVATVGISTLQRIRTIAVIATLSTITAAVVLMVVLVLSLYPSLRVTVQNLERISTALGTSVEHFSGVSEQTAQNILDTSNNIHETSVNLNRQSLDDVVPQTIIRLIEQGRQTNSR